MRWGWICALALVAAPASAVAQQTTLDSYGPYRFGMSSEDVRAVDPTLRSGSLGTLRSDRTREFGGFAFRPMFSFRDNGLSRIVYSARGLVRDAAQCRDVLAAVVRSIEIEMGPLAGAPGPGEYGPLASQRMTTDGSTIRFYAYEPRGQEMGIANSRTRGWIEASSTSGLHEPSGRIGCEIDIDIRPHAIAEATRLTPPTEVALASARFIERPEWEARYSSSDLEMTLPLFRSEGRIQVDVDLDCLVLAGGALNCRVKSENPAGNYYGEMAMRLSRLQRVVAQQDGQPTEGARVPFNVTVSLGSAEDMPTPGAAAVPPAPEELRALAAQAPSAAELEAATLIERPTWIARPNAQSFARYYPVVALERGVDGRAMLDCLVKPDGGLRCAVTVEDPPAMGFGLAALGLSLEFRLPAELDGVATAGRRVRVPIRFNVG